MRVIAFYTNDSYLAKAEGLKQSAEAVGLQCVLIKKPHLPHWWQNCAHKCPVILEAIEKYGDEPFVYNDADTRYVQYPELFDQIGAYDIGLPFLNSNSHPFTGTVFVNGKRSKRYLEAMYANVLKHPEHEDDPIPFRMALSKIRPKLIYHLPPAYCWREGDMRSALPTTKPVIIHMTSGAHDYPVKSMSEDQTRRMYA